MQITKENRNGTPYIRISDPKMHYSVEYFTINCWIDDDNLVVSESDYCSNFSDSRIYLVNLVEWTKNLLVEHCKVSLVHGRTLYYVWEKSFYSLDIDTRETKRICSCEHDIHMPHITSDGRYISLEMYKNEGRHGGAYLVDIVTGEVTEAFNKVFAEPFPTVDHVMICPTDHNKIFFSHEGDTHYVSNRLWLYEKGKGMRCIAKQYLDEDGNLGDCFGHECWAPDGKGLWFVKYPVSPQPPRGLSYVDLEGNQKVAVYGEYPYWHVSCSADGKYLAADTQICKYAGPKMESVSEEDMKLVYDSDCCVINLETGEEKAVIRVVTNSKHPCHPHPRFSPNSKWLCFQDFVDGQVTVGFINMEDVKIFTYKEEK